MRMGCVLRRHLDRMPGFVFTGRRAHSPDRRAEQRAEAFLEDLADDPLDPVISSEYWCFRISHHRVRCDLFAEYLAGDTCVFDYYVFFAGPHSQQIRTRLGNCE